MKLLRAPLLVAALSGAVAASSLAFLVPTDAQASVSIAVAFDALVKDADAVSIVTPVESKSVWEDGRICTYTRVKVEQSVAGDLSAGADGWVRTMGGVVGKVGQLVDGEPVLTEGKPSLLFMRKFKQGGTWEVSARAQGQFPILEQTRDAVKIKKVVRSTSVGLVLPPKAKAATTPTVPGPVVAPQSAGAGTPTTTAEGVSKVRLAGEVLHDRPLDEATREIAAAWKRLHAAPNSATK